MSNQESIAGERWRPIPGFEGYYEASDHGRVRSVDRIVGPGVRSSKGRILSPSVDRYGKRRLWLKRAGQKDRIRLVSQLVLEAFVGPRPEGMCCCHYDDVPDNDMLSNLRWDTFSANRIDSVRNGRHWASNRTHCPRNHPYDEENTYVGPRGDRRCRTCCRELQRAQKQAKRAVSA